MDIMTYQYVFITIYLTHIPLAIQYLYALHVDLFEWTKIYQRRI